MIHDLERTFGRMLQVKAQVRSVYKQLEALGCAPGGDEFDPAPHGARPEVVNHLTTLRTLIDALKDDVKTLEKSGCIVKDIDEGIVDWYASKEDKDVLLCWKLGEKKVAFWHAVDAGFAGRRPISEFFDD